VGWIKHTIGIAPKFYLSLFFGIVNGGWESGKEGPKIESFLLYLRKYKM
jgi:hypothetical protein